MNNQQHIHIYAPGIFSSRGGIQTYSFFLVSAIQNLSRNSKYSIFLKNDSQIKTQHQLHPKNKFYCTGKFINTWRTLAYMALIFQQGLREKPDLIITTHINFTPVAFLLKKLLGIPYWTVAHGIEAWNIQKFPVKKALSHADKILAVSNYTREQLLKSYDFAPEKISILPNTFDRQRFQIDAKPRNLLQRYSLTHNQPVILTVARLCVQEQYKGYDKIIKALPQIKKLFPRIHYILVGQGDDLHRIKQLIKELKLQKNVTLTGFVSKEELSPHYNLCDLFAMPSKGEGFGIVYLEAMACGKPVLAGNQDGAIDALCNGELGALVDPDDINEIAQTIIKILRNQYPNPVIYQPELLRQKVIEKFGFDSFKHSLSKHLDSYVTQS